MRAERSADLIALAPDMSRLLIDMGEAVEDALAALPGDALGRVNHYSALLARLDALGKDSP